MTYTDPLLMSDATHPPSTTRPMSAPGEIAECILAHLVGSSTLVIAFSAMDLHRAFNHKFDFFRLTQQNAFDVILVRDLANSWYQMPVAHQLNSGALLEAYLVEAAQRYKRVVCLGSSMGGYAAILFGRLIGAHHIIAFGPQTCLIPSGPGGREDRRFREQFEQIAKLGSQWRHDDLRNVPYARHVHTSIYYPRDDRMDIEHANWLARQHGVSVLPVAECGHGLINPIRKSGALASMIRHAIVEDAPYDPRPELAHYVSQFCHNLAINAPLEVDAALNVIGFQIVLTNVSGVTWTQQTQAGAAIRLQLFRRDEGVLEERFIPFFTDSFPAQQVFREHVEFSLKELPSGSYVLVADLVFANMSSADIGIAPVALNFDIAPTVILKSVGAFGKAELPIVKRSDNGYGRASWVAQPVGDLHFPVQSGRLATDIGSFGHGVMALSGHEAGFGVYGPWVALQPGCYEAEFDVDPDHLIGDVHIDVVEIPNHAFARRELSFGPAQTGKKLMIRWELAHPVERLEIRLFCLQGFRTSIRSLTIRRVQRVAGLLSRARARLKPGGDA